MAVFKGKEVVNQLLEFARCVCVCVCVCLFVWQAIREELTYQHKDGSFSAFGDNDPSGSMWCVIS